jgi:hypothetical protein
MTKREFTMLDMYVQPGYLIRRAHQVATDAFSAATSDLDLTPVQFSALVAIKDNPDIDATRVSVIIAFDRTTIGHVLGRLEKRKLYHAQRRHCRQTDQASAAHLEGRGDDPRSIAARS